MLALGVCYLQPSWSDSRMFAASKSYDHAWMTTNQLVGFHKNEFNEMPCKMESQATENLHSFEEYPPHPN